MYENYYQIMPELTGEEYDRLKADIAENGCKVPVDVDEDGNILDGHHRAMICDELGIEYETRECPGMTEEEKFEHVVRMNVLRRQLTGEQMHGLIRKVKEEYPDASDRKIAAMIGVSQNTVAKTLENSSGVQSEHLNYANDDKGWDDDEEDGVGPVVKVTGIDNKKYPGENVNAQRKKVRKEIDKNPDKTNYQIAKELGVSQNTVALQREKMNEEPEEAPGAGEEAAAHSGASISTADDLYTTLCGEADKLDRALSPLLDKQAANEALKKILSTDEGAETAASGLLKIGDVVRRYEALCGDQNGEGRAAREKSS